VISAVMAVGMALTSVFSFSVLPPAAQKRQLQVAGAATHVLIDAPRSWVLDDAVKPGDFGNLAHRADLLGTLVTSEPVRRSIGQRIGVSPEEIGASTRITANVTNALSQSNSEERATQLLLSHRRYQLDVQTTPGRPILNIFAQAPSVPEAERLADAAVAALREYVDRQTFARRIAPRWRIRLEQLGAARGGVINGGSVPQIFVLTFLVALSGCACLLLLAGRVRRGRRAIAAELSTGERVRRMAAAGGDWPRTTRVLPWMVAGFLAIVWLVPFNTIELTASLPFDLKFDRLVLPVIFGVWILALAAGGPAAPRLRVTWIHAGIAGFVFAACLSVVLAADYLNLTNQFDLSVKRLFLLLSYGLLFLVISSSVRPTEVRAFFQLTLLLAVVCALGTIWEYRFQYNVFYDLSDKLLPGVFQTGAAEVGKTDMFGRHLTFGPAEHPLEAVGMLTMGLPIALVGLIYAKGRRDAILYGLASCVVLAATIATYRKSALLAPFSVGLTLMYFRRSQLLKLAPLALPAIFLVHFLSPGAFGSIVAQGENLGSGTVSDRASDYDAVRPDLWAHLAFGRGYGSSNNRILDSEVLTRLLDTGIVGVLLYVLMLVSVLIGARFLICSRHERWAPYALAVAAATVAFLVLSFLFDVMAFPHTPYALVSLAALVAIMRTAFDDEARTRRLRPGADRFVRMPVQRKILAPRAVDRA
jgi:hypothetical protein